MNSLATMFRPKLIVQSWIDSLKIFIPANFKLFLLVTLKSLIEGAKVFFVKVFWLWALVLFGGSFLAFYVIPWLSEITFPYKYYVVGIIALAPIIIARLIFEFGWIISIRSSVDIKDITYFKKYLRSFPAMVALWFGFNWLINYVSQFDINPYFMDSFSVISWVMVQITLFFFVESGRSIKEVFQSLWRMITFFIFNLPGLVIFCGVLALTIGLAQNYISQFHWVVWLIMQMLGYMIFICVLYNYFIKRFHDHSELYF